MPFFIQFANSRWRLGEKNRKESNNMDDVGQTYERVKHRIIYPECFPDGISMPDDSFKRAVKKACTKIEVLIPNLSDKGRQDEDWYLAEWMKANRKNINAVVTRTQEDLAYYIYQIRKEVIC